MSEIVKINGSSNITIPSIDSVCLTCSENIFLHKNWKNVGLCAQEKCLNSQLLAEIVYGINSDLKLLFELNENIYICHGCSQRIYQMSKWKKTITDLHNQINKLMENLKLEEQMFKPGIEHFLTTFYSKLKCNDAEKSNGKTGEAVHEIIPEACSDVNDLSSETEENLEIPEVKLETDVSLEETSQIIPSTNHQDNIQIKLETDLDISFIPGMEPEETHEQNNAENEFELNQEGTKKFNDEDDSCTFEDMIMHCDSDEDWSYKSEGQTDSDSEMSEDEESLCNFKKVNTVHRLATSNNKKNKRNLESEAQMVSNSKKAKRKIKTSYSAAENGSLNNSVNQKRDKKRASFNVEFKLKVIEHVEKLTGSNRKTAAHFGICEKQVRDWRKQKDRLCKTNKSAKRFSGAGKKVKQKKVDIEQQLAKTLNKNEKEDKKRASFDVEFKLKVIEHVEKKTGSNRKTAAHFGICEKQVRNWRKLKDQLCKTDRSVKRFSGAGPKVKDPKVEQELVEWVKQKKKEGIIISAKALMMQALQRTTNPDFKASVGWATGFMKRHELLNQK